MPELTVWVLTIFWRKIRSWVISECTGIWRIRVKWFWCYRNEKRRGWSARRFQAARRCTQRLPGLCIELHVPDRREINHVARVGKRQVRWTSSSKGPSMRTCGRKRKSWDISAQSWKRLMTGTLNYKHRRSPHVGYISFNWQLEHFGLKIRSQQGNGRALQARLGLDLSLPLPQSRWVGLGGTSSGKYNLVA